MKRQLILTFILAFGIGVFVGAYLLPGARKAEFLFSSHGDRLSASARNLDNPPHPGAGSFSGASQISSHDDDANLSTLLKAPSSFHQTADLLSYVGAVPVDQIPGLLGQVQTHAGASKDQALSLLVSRWVEADPDGAHDSIATTGDGQIRYLLTKAVFSALAEQNPVDAMRQAQELPTQNERDSAILDVAQQEALHDPAQALALFQATKSGYGGALGAIFTQWTDTDLGQATQAALQLPQANDRSSAIQSIAIRLAFKDPQAAMSWLEQLPPGEALNQARANVVARIANRDPLMAAKYVEGLQQIPADAQNNLVQNVCMYWDETDPKACFQWAEGLPLSQSRNNALQFSLFTILKNDPATAMNLLNALPPDAKTNSSLLSGFASSWAQSDPQAALAWTNQMPAGSTKDVALRSVIGTWATHDPVQAAESVQAMADTPLHKDLVQMVVGSWAENNPAAAAQWVTHLPDSPPNGEIYSSLAGIWARNDPVAASNWLTQLATGPTRDAAIRSFVDHVVAGDPVSAYPWAESISDPNARQQQVLQVLEQWRSIDPAAANAAAQQSTLTAEQKTRFVRTNP